MCNPSDRIFYDHAPRHTNNTHLSQSRHPTLRNHEHVPSDAPIFSPSGSAMPASGVFLSCNICDNARLISLFPGADAQSGVQELLWACPVPARDRGPRIDALDEQLEPRADVRHRFAFRRQRLRRAHERPRVSWAQRTAHARSVAGRTLG